MQFIFEDGPKAEVAEANAKAAIQAADIGGADRDADENCDMNDDDGGSRKPLVVNCTQVLADRENAETDV